MQETELTDHALRQKQHYEKNAETYVSSRQDSLAYARHMDFWVGRLLAPWLAETTEEERREQSVLDPMCGHGNLAPFLVDRCRRLYLNDISPAMLDRIPRDIRDRCILLPASDVCALKLPDDSVDVVVVSGGLHHVYHHVGDALVEIRRVLKPGGIFLFGEPSNEFFLTRVSRNFIYRLSSAFDHDTEMAFRWHELRDRVGEAGFEDVELKPFGSAAYLLMGQLGVVPWLRRSKSAALFRVLRRFDETIENNRLLRRSCFALTGSARKP